MKPLPLPHQAPITAYSDAPALNRTGVAIVLGGSMLFWGLVAVFMI
ncbi:hypothetical protein [Sphingomonas soli]|nr:hypothetical protein [Sphingomonas soli]